MEKVNMQQGKVDNQVTLNDLENIISGVRGKRCWQIIKSYGGVYDLDFGEKVEFSSKVMGEWWISTCGTNFIVSQPSDSILIDTRELDLDEPETIDQITKVISKFIGKKVTSIHIDSNTLSLIVVFDGNTHFRIVPTEEDEQYDEPYWSINFPDGNRLIVGRDRSFAYKKQ